MSSKTGRRPLTLTARLNLLYAAMIVVLTGVFVAVLRAFLIADAQNTFVTAMDQTSDVIHRSHDLFFRVVEEAGYEEPFRMISPEGAVVFVSPAMDRDFPADICPPAGGERDVVTASGKRFSLATREREGWVYQFAVDRSSDREFEMQVYQAALLVALPLLLVCLAAGYAIAAVGLQPVRALAARMRTLSVASPAQHLSTADVPAELAPLAASFNEVSTRVGDAFARLDAFAGDVAHELRTCLHRIRGDAEFALAPARTEDERTATLADIVEGVDAMARLIDRLLLLARLDDPGLVLERASLNVGDEVRRVAEFFHASAAEAGVTLRTHAEDGLSWSLDRALFQRAVSNLVANAVAHTPPGGEVAIEAARESDALALSVRDTGAGIEPASIDRLTERFYRAPGAAAAGGTGLGLAIVKKIARVHGGDLTLTSQPGVGTQATIRVPMRSMTPMSSS